jgi:hypothetical protein
MKFDWFVRRSTYKKLEANDQFLQEQYDALQKRHLALKKEHAAYANFAPKCLVLLNTVVVAAKQKGMAQWVKEREELWAEARALGLLEEEKQL